MKKVLLTLVLIAGCISAMAQWSDNTYENNRITPKDMTLYDTDFKVTPDGLTYFVINRPLNNNIATCLQIIKKDGTLTFPEEGKTISNKLTKSYTVINDLLMVDKDNNALIAVQDARNSNETDKHWSYSIYKVSPTGENLWGEDGIDIEEGHSNDLEAAIRMIQLEDGSYVFAWMANKGNISGIKLQKRSNSGELIWNEEISDNDVPNQYPYLTNAGNNQFCLVYAKGSNQDIMVRKYDFDGTAVWPQDTRVYRGGFPSVPLHVILRVIEDPNGGVFVGWYDDRSFTNKESTFVSYVKPNGTLAFSKGEEGEQVGYSEYRSFGPEMLFDPTENCLYILWRETTGSQGFQRIMAQKMAMTGELKWGSEGIEVAPLSEKSAGYYSIQSAGPGEFTAFYMLNHIAGYGDARAYASRINKDGNAVWESPSMFTSCVADRGSLKSSQLIDNAYWLTLWDDNRTFVDDDPEAKKFSKAYMQKINIDGTYTTSSIQTTSADATFNVYPTLIENQATFTFSSEKTGMANLSVYDLSGQKVSVVYQGQLEKGMHEFTWNASSAGLTCGTYIATLVTPESTQSVRLAVK